MSSPRAQVQKFAGSGVTNWDRGDQEIYFGDVVDERDGADLGVTFIRWRAGEEGEFDYPLPYDEVLVVTKGSYTVHTEQETVTAWAGEVIYLPAGHTGVYSSSEDAEVVGITHPPYRKAIREAGHGDELERMQQVDEPGS